MRPRQEWIRLAAATYVCEFEDLTSEAALILAEALWAARGRSAFDLLNHIDPSRRSRFPCPNDPVQAVMWDVDYYPEPLVHPERLEMLAALH